MRSISVILAAVGALAFSLAADAQEAAVRQALQKKYPSITVESVTRSPIPGLYEVFAGGQIIYADEKVNYLIVDGSLLDVDKKVNLTQERMNKLTAMKFTELPLDLSFRIVRGKGTRKVGYFADPNCGYCRQIEQDLNKLDDVTIHVFLYPILGANSREKSKAVWCSKDRAKAWLDMMLNSTPPAGSGDCDTSAIDKILAFGRQKGITGTPTLFFQNGERVPGAIPLERLEKLLAAK